MAKKSYSEKLLDPRWQKKRLEIMNRAEFRCESCFDDGSTLHVHHLYYFKGHEPWEYENEALVCLCADCHETDHQYREMLNIALACANPAAMAWNDFIGLVCGFLSMQPTAGGAVGYERLGTLGDCSEDAFSAGVAIARVLDEKRMKDYAAQKAKAAANEQT